MNSFEQSSGVSKQSLSVLIPYLEWRGWTLTPYVDFQSQVSKGDYRAVKSSTGVAMNIEVKAEQRTTGNIFVESWSNRTEGRRGWLHNLTECDCLLYAFLDTGNLYTMDFHKLQRFDFSKYREMSQSKYAQHNDTWGWLVPVVDLQRAGVVTQVANLTAWETLRGMQ